MRNQDSKKNRSGQRENTVPGGSSREKKQRQFDEVVGVAALIKKIPPNESEIKYQKIVERQGKNKKTAATVQAELPGTEAARGKRQKPKWEIKPDEALEKDSADEPIPISFTAEKRLAKQMQKLADYKKTISNLFELAEQYRARDGNLPQKQHSSSASRAARNLLIDIYPNPEVFENQEEWDSFSESFPDQKFVALWSKLILGAIQVDEPPENLKKRLTVEITTMMALMEAIISAEAIKAKLNKPPILPY